jgi:signal transduction histidine kinase
MILGAENEIRDALTNLVLNAVDAMPEGGTLTVRSNSLGATSAPVTDAPETRVLVEVCDTGIGMSEAVRNRCLEPFFTTKGERGTGLGLAMVYGMVQRHSAELEIHSEAGAGTTVRLIYDAPQHVDCVLSKPPKLPELRAALAELASGRTSTSRVARATPSPDRIQGSI